MILLVLLLAVSIFAEDKKETSKVLSQEKTVSKVDKVSKVKEKSWSKKAPATMDWFAAKEYCANLNEDGSSDWELPTISELRTLIIDCPASESGGACLITNDCLSNKCWTKDTCWACSGASDGRYSKLGDTDWFWSSSPNVDNAVFVWLVNFFNGSVNGNLKANTSNVRCVKN